MPDHDTNHIFRKSVLERYKTVDTKINSLETGQSKHIAGLWFISIFIFLMGGFTWYVRIPTYTTSSAILVDSQSNSPSVGFYLSANDSKPLAVGDDIHLQTSSGETVSASITEIESDAINLTELEQKYGFSWADIIQIVPKDTSSVFIVASIDAIVEVKNPSQTLMVRVPTGSQRLLFFVPIIGQFFKQ